MALRLIVRPHAEADIDDAAGWYEAEQAGLGSRFLLDVELVLERAAEAPLQFPEFLPGVRRALLHSFPYAVYLKPTEQTVIIVAVLHLSRNPTIWHQRTK